MNVRDLQHLAEAMAHEVRNPLNSMAIHIELGESRLKKIPPSPERDALMKSAGVLAGEIERIDKILDHYLQFAGPPEIDRASTRSWELISKVVAEVQPVASARGVELVFPKTSKEEWAVDADALVDAVRAVLVNAVEASAKGSSVELTTEVVEDQVRIVITDRGEGIASEEINKLFHLGFSHRGRPGIGLAVAKQIVKGHGGSINGRSEGLGKGSTFTIRFPIS